MTNYFIDTHCHLNFKVFRPRWEAVVARASEAGVRQMIVVGTKLKTSARAIDLAQQHSALWAAVGLHPHHVWDYLVKAQQQAKITGQTLDELMEIVADEVIEQLATLAKQPKVVAMGEIGLDYHFYEQTVYENKVVTTEYQRWQRHFFIKQLRLASELGLPIIFHQREAVDEMLAVISECTHYLVDRPVVFHCCEPDSRLLDWVLAHEQAYLGVDGDVTYDRAKQVFIRQVPLTKLVLETDAPYITPEPARSLFATQRETLPYHQRVCEPGHLVLIAQAVAELHQVSLSQVAAQTTANACALFGDDLVVA